LFSLQAAVCDAHNPVDGQRLLSLTSADLRTAPFNMANVHEIDHLHSCIESLRKSQLTKYLEEHNVSDLAILSRIRTEIRQLWNKALLAVQLRKAGKPFYFQFLFPDTK